MPTATESSESDLLVVQPSSGGDAEESSWEGPGLEPQTDPAVEAPTATVVRAPAPARRRHSEPSPALRPRGEGSVYRPPRRQTRDPSTDQALAVRRRPASALHRRRDQTEPRSGLLAVTLVIMLILTAITVLALLSAPAPHG